MYKINDYILYGNRGVCKIQNIAALELTGLRSEEIYFWLQPVAQTHLSIYIPVSRGAELAPLLPREEALRILQEFPQIPAAEPMSRFQLEQYFKESMQQNDPRRLLALLKFLSDYRLQRMRIHKKVNASVQRYLREARQRIIETLSYALQQDGQQIELSLSLCLQH